MFRIEKQLQDAVITKQIQNITAKRFLGQWKRRATARLGASFLEETFQRLQKRSFFK
jgi:hypothetical protein